LFEQRCSTDKRPYRYSALRGRATRWEEMARAAAKFGGERHGTVPCIRSISTPKSVSVEPVAASTRSSRA
jgi:hypothetical protein